MGWKVSVGRRINALIVFQTAMMILVIALASYALSKLSMDTNHMYRFQLLPVGDIADHLEKAAELQRIVHPDVNVPKLTEEQQIERLHNDLLQFNERYRRVWDAEHQKTTDNQLFLEDLKKAGQLKLLETEESAFNELEAAIADVETHFKDGKLVRTKAHWDSVVRLRESLATLLALNMEFAHTANAQIEARAQATRTLQIIIGVLSIIVTLIMGVFVHRAIAPRIGRLVAKVSRFKEFGVNEKVIEEGRDEITILANAIDAGFAAIVERDKERDQFLAVAAHELKTPITSIQGFSSLLAAEGTSSETRAKAIQIINKQSWRLSRLIEGLFLMMRARTGNMKFSPAPVNLTAVVEKILQEVKPFIPTQSFSFKNMPVVNILGDELLLGHALWSLLTCASAFSEDGSVVQVVMTPKGSTIYLEVVIIGKTLNDQEIDSLFLPFHTVEYETGAAIRGAIGLYLSREIFRVHQGSLRAKAGPSGTLFCVELPL